MTFRAPTTACVFTSENFAVSKTADTQGEVEKLSFAGKANSGAPLNHAFWENFAIDMKGVKVARLDLPVLRDHDPGSIIGYTTAIKLSDAGIDVEGYLIGANDSAREVMTLMKHGAPLQMSVYVKPSRVLRLEQGDTSKVNGHQLSGPGHIFQESHLREVTITAMGADEDTTATLLSRSQGEREVSVVQYERLQAEQEKQMSEQKNAPVTAAELAAQHPEIIESIRAEAAAQGRDAERQRVEYAFAQGKHVDRDVVLNAISKGLETGAIAEVYLSHVIEKADKAQDRLAQLRETAPQSVGASPIQEFRETGIAPTAPATDEELRLKWSGDDELRSQFATFEDYKFDLQTGGDFSKAGSLI